MLAVAVEKSPNDLSLIVDTLRHRFGRTREINESKTAATIDKSVIADAA